MDVALIVPVLNRFDLFARLIKSVDYSVRPVIIKNWEYNNGVARSWNIGMSLAFKEYSCRYAIIANDDTEFKRGTIERMLDTIQRERACIISANPNGESVGQSLIEKKEFSNFVVDIPRLITYCGEFDENFFPAYFEDDDMFYRVKLSGQKIFVDPEALILHHGSATQNLNIDRPVCSPIQFSNNRNYYEKKWGGLPGQETYCNPYNDSAYSIKDWNRS